MSYSLSPWRSAALVPCSVLVALLGCTSTITVKPDFQPLPTLSLASPPGVQVAPNGFRFCYRDEPCKADPALGARYAAMVAATFHQEDPLAPSAQAPVRVVTEMRLVDDHQGRVLGYGLLFGPLAFLTPMPYPMALDFLTISTTLDAEGKPIRVYRSRQLVEFWTYSAWGLRDPNLLAAAMRHHLRALERNLQFDTALYAPPAPAPSEDSVPAELVEPPLADVIPADAPRAETAAASPPRPAN